MQDPKILIGSKVEVIDEVRGVLVLSNGVELKVPALKAKRVPEKVITVYAFTGMRIGDLEVVKETPKEVTVITADGKKEMVFDKKTGLQTNAKSARFANRLKPLEKKSPKEEKKEEIEIPIELPANLEAKEA